MRWRTGGRQRKRLERQKEKEKWKQNEMETEGEQAERLMLSGDECVRYLNTTGCYSLPSLPVSPVNYLLKLNTEYLWGSL